MGAIVTTVGSTRELPQKDLGYVEASRLLLDRRGQAGRGFPCINVGRGARAPGRVRVISQ